MGSASFAGWASIAAALSCTLPASTAFAAPKSPKKTTAANKIPAPVEITNRDQANAHVLSELTRIRAMPESDDRKIQESRMLFYQGTFKEGTKDEKLVFFDQGKELALGVLSASPENAEATLWWTANEGAAADLRRSLGALKRVTVMERALVKLKSSQPDFRDGAAFRILGRMYQRAPGIISVGSMSRAGEQFTQVLAKYPGYPGNHIFYADYLVAKEKKAEAQAALDQASQLSYGHQDDLLDRYYWRLIEAEVRAELAKL